MKPSLAVLLLVAACGWGTTSLDGRARMPTPPQSRCGPVDSSIVGIGAMPGERVRTIVCVGDDGKIEHGLLIIDEASARPFAERLTEAYSNADQWEATAPPTLAPTTLSGTPATEHRQPFETLAHRLLVARYVQNDDTLYMAWASGILAKMQAREADNAAWLDAVRFADLERSP